MKSILCWLICLAAATYTYAESISGYTVEWLSHQSSLIAKATPVELENIKENGKSRFIKIRFRLDEILKGSMSNGDLVSVYDINNYKDFNSLFDAKKENKQLLIFASVSKHRYDLIDGKFIFTKNNQFKSVFFPDPEIKNLFTPEFKLVKDFDELIERAKAQIQYESNLDKRYWKGKIERKSLDIPSDTEAFKILYAGSSCFLWVPDYIEGKADTSNISFHTNIVESWGNQKDFFIENNFEIIDWEEAKSILQKENLKGGKQYHTGWLTIYTLDEKKYLVKQPMIDSIWKFAESESITLNGFASE